MSLEDLALSIAIDHLIQARIEVRQASVENYERLLFPNLGTSTAQTKWRSYRNFVRVTLWGREHFRNNVCLLAMVCEALGLGPCLYCITWSLSFNFLGRFNERLFLLLQFLPHDKISIDLDLRFLLRGPFLQSSHTRDLASAIYQRRISWDERPNICPACETSFCDHALDGLTEV